MADVLLAREQLPPSVKGIPERRSDTHEELAAWYSGFAFSEHYRKVTLAQCREMIRASCALSSQKVTEARLDDLAHSHSLYLEYLEKHLRGRILWEKAFLRSGGMG